MATDKTCPACGKPACMPPHDYFFGLASDCLEELDAHNHLPRPYTTEKVCLLERHMIANAKTIFCHFHGEEIGSEELEQIKMRKTLTILAHAYEAFLIEAASYIREQLLQVHGVPAPRAVFGLW
jgi:hypothetical protein